MPEPDLTKMPWGGIAKVTGGVFVLLTAVAAAAVRQARREQEEANRFRWTDKNRWE